MRLPFFPAPYDDELFYSVAARYHEWSTHAADKHTVKDLLGRQTLSAVFDLPGNLQEVCRNIGSEHLEVNRLIDDHSMFPVYRPFLAPERIIQLEQAMASGSGGALHTRSGVMASSVPMIRTLRFCSSCITADTESHGEPYWHRSHQLHGVDCCHIHRIPLREAGIIRDNKHVFSDISQDVAECVGNPLKLWQYSEVIASEVNWLLTNTPRSCSSTELSGQYHSLLRNRGYADYNGRIKKSELKADFQTYYGVEYLQYLGCSLEGESHWLARLLRKGRTSVHPIKHILLAHFLDSNLADFFSRSKELPPFGEGPWMCLNSAASHYRQRVVTTCIITRDYETRGIPVGTFSCDCGFVYSRRGPDTDKDDCYKIGRIKNFGRTWEERLVDLINTERKSYRAAAHILKVDPTTAKRQYLRIQAGMTTNVKIGYQPTPDDREERRGRWQSYVDSHPEMNRKEVRKALPAEFAWLYRNDKEWLDVHSPASLPRKKWDDTRVDWKARDRELANHAMSVIGTEISGVHKPIRLTLSYIGKQMQQLALLQQHLDKLPDTAKVIGEYSESIDDFQVRRVKYVVNQMYEERETVLRWKIIRAAGLKPGFSAVVNEAIEQCLVESLSL
ncbi:TnsD family Tn7-like transposition protein [Paenibacillus sp. MMS18-CY102]|uniref:TnsD family Tn7-like transposition protein n=1 Tax=Paenibacillus sp. MMS18-CY102 TaxID=2682849 RepID=UPI00136609EA|nr:TnsD family Tn7-like transposition protein [Paenibacillus sp. MMS18-CY102]MWC27176.1 hypothetical protein [Paenibacillus sp. MMS18-CY102]